MGRNSGGNGTGGGGSLPNGDATYKGDIKNVESLKNIKDPQLYKEVKSAIARFESVLGVRQQNVKLATLSGAYGVHVTVGGKSDGVYLNKKHFKNGTKESIVGKMKSDYKSGHLTETNKPVAHVVTHELAHATWNAHLSGAKHVAAGNEIKALYSKFSADKKQKGYGRYSHSNVSEFFAEVATKAVHGKPDKYTEAVKGIIKKYNL